MQRIDTPNRALALYGAGKDGFKDGNLSLGVNPTEFDAAWCNAVQEEIASVVESTGVALDPTSRTQLYAAIQKLIEMRVGDYALDTGTANAKVVALNPVLAAYTTNFDGSFKNAVANTGPCTVNFGPSAVPLVRDDGAALGGGDLAAGMIIFYNYVQADGKAYVTSMVNSQGDARYLLQNNPTLGLVETFADPAGARCRRYYDITGLTGMQYNGVNVNAEYMTVNNTSITGGVWAGRDVAGPCWAEVMSDQGQKLYYYAPTAAAGAAPAWSYAFGWDLSNGAAKGMPAGTPLMWPLPVAPTWALVRDGSAISRTAYANLYAALCPTRNGTTTNASAAVTGLSSTADLYIGMPVEGAGIPAGTTIASITSGTAITLSANATASGAVPITLFYFGYGSGGSAATFGVPDDRGVFERGLDTGAAGRDTLTYACANTSGQALITGLASTLGMSVGMALSGTGVPGGATIAQINSATSITMSAVSTAAVSALSVTGNRIGAYSTDQVISHTHLFTAAAFSGGSGSVTGGVYSGATTQPTQAYGNNETKPKNRAYLPIIVY